jgi:hypothetical protein
MSARRRKSWKERHLPVVRDARFQFFAFANRSGGAMVSQSTCCFGHQGSQSHSALIIQAIGNLSSGSTDHPIKDGFREVTCWCNDFGLFCILNNATYLHVAHDLFAFWSPRRQGDVCEWSTGSAKKIVCKSISWFRHERPTYLHRYSVGHPAYLQFEA